MRVITAHKGQSVYDIALQFCGDISFAYMIANINDMNINETVDTTQKLMVPECENKDSISFATGVLEVWVLDNGVWNDMGSWMDGEFWID